MKLHELSFACYVYYKMNNSDKSYKDFLSETSPQLNLLNTNHQKALLGWLNKWGCRQFSKKHHKSAAEQISSWYEEFESPFFRQKTTLLGLSDEELDFIQEAFDNLMDKTASWRKLRNKPEAEIKIGPTGAAKILFALRPDVLVPWDGAIRKSYNLKDTGDYYRSFLIKVREHLSELKSDCEKYGINLEDLPRELKRSESSLVKLVDEFFWVTITRGCESPSISLLKRWMYGVDAINTTKR